MDNGVRAVSERLFYMYSKYYFVLIRVKNKVHRFHHWGVCAQI